MPHTCVVPGCQSVSCRDNSWLRITDETVDPVSFHSLPSKEHPKLRKKWLVNLCRPVRNLPKKVEVCSKHFTLDSFDESTQVKMQLRFPHRPVLKPDAVPTIFPFKKNKLVKPRPSSERHAMKRKLWQEFGRLTQPLPVKTIATVAGKPAFKQTVTSESVIDTNTAVKSAFEVSKEEMNDDTEFATICYPDGQFFVFGPIKKLSQVNTTSAVAGDSVIDTKVAVESAVEVSKEAMKDDAEFTTLCYPDGQEFARTRQPSHLNNRTTVAVTSIIDKSSAVESAIEILKEEMKDESPISTECCRGDQESIIIFLLKFSVK